VSRDDDLTDEERTAVIYALKAVIDRDRYPRSPRLAPFRSALAKLDPASGRRVYRLPRRRRASVAASERVARFRARVPSVLPGSGDGCRRSC
jgi:hypothetical protein